MSFFSNTAAPLKLAAQHRASPVKAQLLTQHLSFAEYVSATRTRLQAAHQNQAECAKIVAGNAPFEIKPAQADGQNQAYRRGIVLTHGLTDSPYFMRTLGEFFAEQGFVVMAILLPGHGTQAGDLLKVHRDEWAQTLRYAVNCLASEADEIYLAGLSTGATLSIQHSLVDTRIRGLFLFSPALQITPRAALARLHCLTSWLAPRSAWVEIQADRDLYKYESLTKNAVAQIYALTKNVQHQLRRQPVRVPIFTALSADDATVNSAATLAFMAQAEHPLHHTVLYATRQLNLAQKNIECVLIRDESQHILSSAHTAIVLPDDDAHYGAAGNYANCVHYFPDQLANYQACLNPASTHYRGEINHKNLQQGVLRRLMTNPKFSELSVSLQQFIEQLN
ncbi:MAG: alpha/beta fold hydrolase [Gallionella sp.]